MRFRQDHRKGLPVIRFLTWPLIGAFPWPCFLSKSCLILVRSRQQGSFGLVYGSIPALLGTNSLGDCQWPNSPQNQLRRPKRRLSAAIRLALTSTAGGMADSAKTGAPSRPAMFSVANAERTKCNEVGNC